MPRYLVKTFPCSNCGKPGIRVERLADGPRVRCANCNELTRLLRFAAWAIDESDRLAKQANSMDKEAQPYRFVAAWLEIEAKRVDAVAKWARALDLMKPAERLKEARKIATMMEKRATTATRISEHVLPLIVEQATADAPVRLLDPPAQLELPGQVPEVALPVQTPALRIIRGEGQ